MDRSPQFSPAADVVNVPLGAHSTTCFVAHLIKLLCIQARGFNALSFSKGFSRGPIGRFGFEFFCLFFLFGWLRPTETDFCLLLLQEGANVYSLAQGAWQVSATLSAFV